MTRENCILVGVDFSPCSVAAVFRAARLARWLNAPLTAVHVVAPATVFVPSPAGPMIPGVVFPTDENLVDRVRRRWDDFVRQCEGAERARLMIEIGSPRDRLLGAVRRERPRMLVMGAHGSRSDRRGVGTTAAACAQWAACPVLIVREDQPGPARSVVACVDFGETSLSALEHAISIASEDGASLHILHVYSDPWRGLGPPEEIVRNMPGFAARYRESIGERLREFCGPMTHELNALKPEFHVVEASGHGDGITAFIREQRCDLAVLGTRGRFSMRDFFWGSTAERVIREAPCSVLAVKPRAVTEPRVHLPAADAPEVPAGLS